MEEMSMKKTVLASLLLSLILIGCSNQNSRASAENMDIKVKDKVNQRHVGRNLQRIRVYLGMKQEALASDLGVSQQEISKIEKQDEIEDGLLTKIAEVLGISTDVIKDFDVEKAICNINNYKDATISPGAIATVYAHNQQINPLEKVVELYERLLKSEQEKIEILRECIKQGK